MNRYVLATGAILIAIGFSVFLVKTGVYGLPLAPTASLGSWQVELRINVRGEGRRGSVRALLPTSVEGQAVFDERSSSGRLTANRTSPRRGWHDSSVASTRAPTARSRGPVHGNSRSISGT